MTRRTPRGGNATARTRTRHELDEVVLDTAKNAMKGTAAPVLARINKLEKAAAKNIAKREKFVDAAEDLKDEVRDAYDDGDASAVNAVVAKLDAYERSLLRPSRRKTK